MSISLTRRHVSSLAKLDFAGLSHLQRIDRIAQVFGHANQASLMAILKTLENTSSDVVFSVSSRLRTGATLAELGLSHMEEWRRGLSKNGLFLFVGPCGSGKTTTLNASMIEIHDKREPSVGSTFIGDQVSARMSVEMTRHLDVVLATMHAGSLKDAFFRLQSLMEVPVEDLRAILRGVIMSFPLREDGAWRALCELVVFDSPEQVDRALNGEVFWETLREDAARMEAQGLLRRETILKRLGVQD